MKMNLKPLVPAILAALSTLPVQAVDFTGYVRSGLGISNNGGGVKGGDELAKSKLGRLGNEFDTYSEIGLGKELYQEEGKSFYFESMFAMSADGNLESEETTKDTANFAIKQLNLQAKGFIAAAPEATIWAGKRFYQRHDLHIIDTKYWNISGYGFGVEGLNLGSGALSAAIIRGDQDDLNINYLDIRYAGFSPWQGAWTEFGIDYALPNPTDSEKESGKDFDNGLMLTAELSQSFSRGYNKTVLQYADSGLAQNMISQGGGWFDAWTGDVNSAKGYRIINTGDFTLSEKISFNHVLTYGYAKNHGDVWVDAGNNIWEHRIYKDEDLFSAVIRPQYAWSKHHKTVLELGYYTQTRTSKSGVEDKSGGQKFTVAQVLSAGEYLFVRPEMRLYASYLKDNEEKSFNDGRDQDDIKFGVQIEAWF
ncbi:MAG: maltoporin [Vibrio sp.]